MERKVAKLQAASTSSGSSAARMRLPLLAFTASEADEGGMLSEGERAALRQRLAVLERLQRTQAAQREEQWKANEQPADAAAILFSTLLYESSSSRRTHSSDKLVDALSEAERRAAGLLASEGVAGSALMACSIADLAGLLASSRQAREHARDALHGGDGPVDAPTLGPPPLSGAAAAEEALAGSGAVLSHARQLGLA